MPARHPWRVAASIWLFGCADVDFDAARSAERRGDLDRAVEAYERAIRAYPNHYEAAWRIARIECWRRKDADRCRRWAERLASLDPDPRAARALVVEAAYLEARERYLAGDLREARRRLEDVVEKEPNHARGHFLAGRAAERLDDRAAALRAYGLALKARPQWSAPAEARRRLAGR